MTTNVRPGPWRVLYGETLAMASTAKALNKPPGATAVRLSGTSNFTAQLCPLLRRAFTYVGTTYTDVTANFADKDTSTVNTLNDFATSSILYLGSDQQFRGCYVNVTNTNGNDAVLDAEYYNGTTWADLTETDGTIQPAGKSLGVDGAITWTLPSDWEQSAVNSSATLFWVRFKWDAALDATVSIADLVLLHKESNAGNFLGGLPHELGLGGEVGGIEAIESGASTLTLTWLSP